MIVWQYVDTFRRDEPITCPSCEEQITVGLKDAITEFECICGQALRVHNKMYHVHEVYAKKEVADGENKAKTQIGSKETSTTEHA